MAKWARPRDGGVRAAIAQEAARLAAEHAHTDLALARRKAARRLGISDSHLWPELNQVEDALRQRQSLFHEDRQTTALAELRAIAVQAMQELREFEPRLTGAVLEGTADEHSPIRLLLMADTVEHVIFALQDLGRPWLCAEITLCYSRGRREKRPLLRFEAGHTPVELVVLSSADRADPPLAPESNKPARALRLKELLPLIGV